MSFFHMSIAANDIFPWQQNSLPWQPAEKRGFNERLYTRRRIPVNSNQPFRGYYFILRRRRPQFIGKRALDVSDLPEMSAGDFSKPLSNHLLHTGMKRAAPVFIGKRNDLEKRAHMFIGRRSGLSDPSFEDDLYDDALSESNSLDKRAHMFIGKRRRMFVGKKSDDSDFLDSEDKRVHMFVGKRQDEQIDDTSEPARLLEMARLLQMENSKRAPAFVGKRDGVQDEEDKRAHMFVGKKLAPSFVGKRRAPGFIGRRQAPGFIGKRNFIVKRSAPEDRSNREEALQDN